MYIIKKINKFLSNLIKDGYIKNIDSGLKQFKFKEINATKEIAYHLKQIILSST